MAVECKYQTGNDEYATPAWIKDGMFRGWYDPCPLSMGLVERDGLNSPWPSDRIFINPPYSKPMPWCQRAVAECKKGKTVALLLKNDSSTEWYRLLHENGAEFLMINGRLHFNGTKAAACFPSIIVILYPDGGK